MSADLQYTLGIDSGNTGKALDAIGSKLVGLGAVAFGGALLSRGFKFNQTMYDGERAIRSIVQQFQGLNAEAAKPIAADAMRQLVDLEPKVAGSLADIVSGFVSTAAASAGVGISVEQNIDLVGRFANALGKMSMPVNQVGQELRSILTGNIGADSALAKTLGITNEMVAAAKKAGNLYEMLTGKIGMLGEAGDNAATAFSSFQSAVDKAAGALASGLFTTAINESGTLSGELDKNREAFQSLGEAIGLAAREAIKFGGFVNEAAKGAAYWVAVAADMVSTGRSFEEVTSEMEAIANAQEHATKVAKEQAEAEKEAAKAAADAAAVKSKAAMDAAAATAKAGLTADPDAKGKKKKGEDGAGGFDAEAAAKSFDAILDQQERLDALKKQSAKDEMDTAQKIAAVQAEIAAAKQEEAILQGDFVQDQAKILEAEIKRTELQRELAALQKQQNHDADEAAKKAQEHAEQARRARTEKENARNEGLGELAVLREQAKGHDKKAEAIEKQMRLAREIQSIMEKQGATEADATRQAKEKMSLEDRIAKRKERGSRDENQGAHIGGVTARHMMGSGFGALEMKSPAMAGKGLDGTAQAVSRRLSQTNAASPLSGRISDATTVKPAEDKSKQAPSADPVLAKLEAIHGELARIRTT